MVRVIVLLLTFNTNNIKDPGRSGGEAGYYPPVLPVLYSSRLLPSTSFTIQ